MSKSLDTMIGKLCITETDGYITSVNVEDSEDNSPTELEIKTAKELTEYFNGTRKSFTVPYKITSTPFALQVYEALVRVPYGEIVSYQDLAIMIGDQKKCRAVGNALHVNPIPIIVPCHRVVKKDRSLGGFGLGGETKKALLLLEKNHA